jgi:hypothetical protein
MNTELLILIVFVAGAYCGYKINELLTAWTLRKMLEDAGVTDKQLEQFVDHWKPQLESHDRPVVRLKLETQGDMIYAFQADSDEFVAQGRGRDELLAVLEQKFSNATVVVNKDQGGELIK